MVPREVTEAHFWVAAFSNQHSDVSAQREDVRRPNLKTKVFQIGNRVIPQAFWQSQAQAPSVPS